MFGHRSAHDEARENTRIANEILQARLEAFMQEHQDDYMRQILATGRSPERAAEILQNVKRRLQIFLIEEFKKELQAEANALKQEAGSAASVNLSRP